MIVKTAICDDESSQIQIVKDLLLKYSVRNNIEFDTDGFLTGKELLRYYDNTEIEKAPYDLIFLDMEMPDINGLDTAEYIRKAAGSDVIIVFVTNYPEYMHDSFDVQPSQCFIKPLSYDVFEQKLNKVIKKFTDLSAYIVVSKGNEDHVLHLKDIVCIETYGRGNLVFTLKNKEIVVKGQLAYYDSLLKEHGFISVHRTCVANLSCIDKFGSGGIVFSNGKVAQVSRGKLDEIKDACTYYQYVFAA